MVEITKTKKPYKPKKYETQQLVWADEVRYLGNDLFLSDNLLPLLNRWIITNKVTPVIDLPIRYSVERRRFEFLRQPTYTMAGAKKVAVVGGGLERNDTKTGTTTDAWSSAIKFDAIVSVIDIWIWDNDMDFQRSPDGVIWDDVIQFPAGEVASFDAATHSFKVKSHTTGLPATYQIVGWW